MGVPSQAIDAVREFSRFYTRRLGILREGLLDSPYSLTEMRILYELAHHDDLTASRLTRDLDLDAGYLSRILRSFERSGLILKTRSPEDQRQLLLRLSKRGRLAFEPLDRKSRDNVAEILGKLSRAEQSRLVGAMRAIEQLMDNGPAAPRVVVLRDLRPGDLGWIIQQHTLEEARERKWSADTEAEVAERLTRLVKRLEPLRDRIWVAEKTSIPVGCAVLMRDPDEVATVASLLVDPAARRSGIGTGLVTECIAFARATGCSEIRLVPARGCEPVARLAAKFCFSPAVDAGRQAGDEVVWRLALEA